MPMQQWADVSKPSDFRHRSNILPKFSRSVCLCIQPGGLRSEDSYNGYCVCKTCGRLPVYFLHRCVDCDSIFLHDFHQNFCHINPRCWDCNSENKACDEHIYCTTYIRDEERIGPMVVLKEAFTNEELDSVFDF